MGSSVRTSTIANACFRPPRGCRYTFPQASLTPPGFLTTIRTVAETLSRDSDEMVWALGRALTAALACVSTVSSDRKVYVQQPAPFANQWEKSPMGEPHQQQDAGAMEGGTAPQQTLRTPSGLIGDPFQMKQWYLHSFFGNFTIAAERTWQKLEALKGKPRLDGEGEIRDSNEGGGNGGAGFLSSEAALRILEGY